MRVLQVLRAPTGGLWRHVVDLSGELIKRGHDVGIMFDSGFSDPQTARGLSRLEPHLKLGVHRVPIPRQPGIGDVSASLKFRGIAKRVDAQVVHGHGAKGGLYARIARIGSNQRVSIYTPHGGVLNFEINSMNGRVFRMVERLLLPFTNGIVFESAFAQRAYIKQIGTPGCKTPVVYNGLSAADFEPIGKDAVEYDFVFVGEIREVKGLRYLIEALSIVRAQGGRQPNLLLAGGGPQEQLIREKISAAGLTDFVHLAGVQPAREMFAKGRCVVIPSLAESLPYVVLEAIAAGRHIISTQVGGISEIFGPTADRLVPAANSDALAAAMQSYLDDPAGVETEMAIRGAYVAEHFSVERMVDGIEGLYQSLIRR